MIEVNGQPTMDAQDAIFGSLAECYATISGRRLNFMSLFKFESKWKNNIAKVPIRGRVGTGHKAAGGEGTWSGTAHYNQSYLRAIALEYKKTGHMPYFEIQVSNEDPTSRAGRQTITHTGCLSEELTLAKFESGENILDEDMSGTFEDWDMPERFNDLPGENQ